MTPETIPSELASENLFLIAFTANGNGTGVDIKDYIGKIKVDLNAAAAANDNQGIAVALETSDEADANYAAFDPALAFTTLAANAAAQVQSISLDTRLAKRYVRVAALEAAAGNSRLVSVTLTGKKQVTA